MYDLAIIGGGINGCGIARDAAGRGLKVLLAEKGDLAGATSSASTKLIHGGLRYLERYAFRLVREALSEREVLWAMAPHIIWPLRFVLPHHAGLRPAFFIRTGLFLYDHLGGRRLLPASRGLDLARDEAGPPLEPRFRRGFSYADCWVDDARLVILNAVDAARRGAEVRVDTEVLEARRTGGRWSLELGGPGAHGRATVEARILVNAAGPWVGEVLARRTGLAARSRARLVKGSHIVVPRLFEHASAYILQNADRRVVFAIPYEQDFTLVGTTDVEFTGDPATAAATPAEIDYLCTAVSAWFRRPVAPADVVWTYSGVRALYDDGLSAAQEVTRDFVLEVDAADGAAPLLSVFGGKITTYRRLAEAALDRLGPWLGRAGPPWTRGATLPGGDFPVDGAAALAKAIAAEHPALPAALVVRLVRLYGTRARALLAGCRAPADLGHRFGADLYEREVAFLIAEEWARTADDVLWRRTKLGLRLTATERRDLDGWMAAHVAMLAGG
jgi:glycerol-3-phosphate dehydrogenase